MVVLGCGSCCEGKLKALLCDHSASYCPLLLTCLKSRLYAVISGTGSDPQTGFLYDKHL